MQANASGRAAGGGLRTIEKVAGAAGFDGDRDSVAFPFHRDVDGLPSAEPRPVVTRVEHVNLENACNK
jgi:hypothetical protein